MKVRVDEARQRARDVRWRSRRHRVPTARHELLRRKRAARQHVSGRAVAKEGPACGEGHESLHCLRCQRAILRRCVRHAGAGDAGDDARIRRGTGRAFPDVHRRRRAGLRGAAPAGGGAAARRTPAGGGRGARAGDRHTSITPACRSTTSSRRRSRKRSPTTASNQAPRSEGALVTYISLRMENRGGAPVTGTPELYFTDPDGLAIQLQDTKYCGGGGYLGDVCPG